MADTTPNKVGGRPWVQTSGQKSEAGFALSPFLPQSNQFYMCTSPLNPPRIAYVSPDRNPSRPGHLEQLLIGMCERYTSQHIFRKGSELRQLAVKTPEPVKKPVSATPAKPLETESTCEGSDLKVAPKTENRSEMKRPAEAKHEESDEKTQEDDRVVRRRKRKSIEQLKLLAEEYRVNPNWNKTTMSEVAHRTGLSEAQVYKWSWDQKRKKVDPESTS